jgi:CRP-like cAMP-binding protein
MNLDSRSPSRLVSTSPIKPRLLRSRGSELRSRTSYYSASKSSTQIFQSRKLSQDLRACSPMGLRNITPDRKFPLPVPILQTKIQESRKSQSMSQIHKRFSVAEEYKRNSSNEFFPAWLLSRPDFKETITQLNQIDGTRIGRICAKPPRDRSSLEKKCIERWMESVPFFADMGKQKLKDLIEVLNTESFEEGQALVKQGEDADSLYIVLEGTIGIFFNEGTEPVAYVKPINIIGESSLEKGNRRIATAKAMSVVITIKLMAEDFENVALKTKLDRKAEMAKFIKSIKFFSEWPYSKILNLVSNMFMMTYKKGTVIYDVGDDAIQFYVVYKGGVSLEVEIPIQSKFIWPKERHKWGLSKNMKTFKNQLKLLKPGDFFGEREIIVNHRRDCKAVVVQESTVIYILNKEYLLEIINAKEKDYLLNRGDSPPPADKMRQIVKNRLKEEKLKLNYLLDAVNFNVQPEGRDYFYTSKLKKKHSIAANLFKRYRRNISKGLVQDCDEVMTLDKQSAISIV